MTATTDIAIIGAGPYGLSIAAYLGAHGIDHRIFGTPMQSWRENMPESMCLKSAGFASNLYEPSSTFTLEAYCKSISAPYKHIDLPIQLKLFCDYGSAFQRKFVPNLEDKKLISLNTDGKYFRLGLTNETSFTAKKVIIAVGINYFKYIPEEISSLSSELVTHSANHRNLEKFKDKRIIVLGAGASAIDIAVLLHEAGARVQQIIRKDKMQFGGDREQEARSFLRKISNPLSAIGPGWKNQFCVSLPWLFRYLPDNTRIRIVRHRLGPSGGWFMKQRATGVPILFNKKVDRAEPKGNSVCLHLKDLDGCITHLNADHIISATGYRADMRRLPFLGSEIVEHLNVVGGSPVLSANFASSISGLYFVGPISAMTFGPLMRFAVGADFTSRRITKHLLKSGNLYAT